jgi:hypothetical protein
VYDLGGEGKQLGLRVKERIVTDYNLQLKVTGLLNTVTGHFGYFASLRKFFGSHPGTSSTSWSDQQLAKRQPRLGAGIYYVSDTEDVLLALSARKYFDLGSDMWLLCKVHASFDTRTQRVRPTKPTDLCYSAIGLLLSITKFSVDHRVALWKDRWKATAGYS